MRFNQKSITVISSLVTVAMLGLITVQMILLLQSIHFQHEIFRQNAKNMLTHVIQQLETLAAMDQVMSVSVGIDSQGVYSATTMQIRDAQDDKGALHLRNIQHYRSAVAFDSNKVVAHLNEPSLIRLVLLDTAKTEVREVYRSFKPAGIHQIPIDQLVDEQIVHFNLYINETRHPFYLDKSSPGRLVIDPQLDESRAALINRIIGQYMLFEPVPIQERLRQTSLDSTIHAMMDEFNFKGKLQYGILNSETDSLVYKSADANNIVLQGSPYRSRLFPNDSFIEANDLAFHFPNQKRIIINQLSGSAFFACIFLLMLLIGFLYILKILRLQKRFSQQLVDFINNMTHEFKTPISTIALASETMEKDEVLNDKNRLVKYSHIIHDESNRMRKQVENILDMAALERGEVELNQQIIHLHDLVNRAADHFKLVVEQQQGKIDLKLEATSDRLIADKIHLMNVIHNLLDNAVKYSNSPPEIVLSTENQNHRIHLSIQDNGPGIETEHQKRIFDKYFRVPAGNLHNVKGFGLGLSYVKLIVEAHQGIVEVKSSLGNGSRFIVQLPLKEDSE